MRHIRTILTLVALVTLATSAEAARWRRGGTIPVGAQTRTATNGTVCWLATNETGTNECRWKLDNGCKWTAESGTDQCTPTSTPPPPAVGEWIRFEGSRAHLYSNDGTLEFNKYFDASGAQTMTWKTSSDTVSLVVNSTGMTVTRNGTTLKISSTIQPTDQQMLAVSNLLTARAPNGSVGAVSRFQLKAEAKRAAIKTTAALSPVASGVESSYLTAGAFIDSLTGDGMAFGENAENPGSGSSQKDCWTDFKNAQWQYWQMYQQCYNIAVAQAMNHWFYSMPGDAWFCAFEYQMRMMQSVFQEVACMAIPKL